MGWVGLKRELQPVAGALVIARQQDKRKGSRKTRFALSSAPYLSCLVVCHVCNFALFFLSYLALRLSCFVIKYDSILKYEDKSAREDGKERQVGLSRPVIRITHF